MIKTKKKGEQEECAIMQLPNVKGVMLLEGTASLPSVQLQHTLRSYQQFNQIKTQTPTFLFKKEPQTAKDFRVIEPRGKEQ